MVERILIFSAIIIAGLFAGCANKIDDSTENLFKTEIENHSGRLVNTELEYIEFESFYLVKTKQMKEYNYLFAKKNLVPGKLIFISDFNKLTREDESNIENILSTYLKKNMWLSDIKKLSPCKFEIFEIRSDGHMMGGKTISLCK